MDDPSWQRNCTQLSQSLRALGNKTGIIRRSTNKLVTPKDIAKEREKVKQTTASANNEVHAIQESLKLMERFMKLHPAIKNEGVERMNDAQRELVSYQKTCDQFYRTCISIEEAAQGRSSSRLFHEEEEDTVPGEADGFLAPTQQSTFERDVLLDIMEERQRETQEIVESLADIREIFQHINEMVGEQGVQIDLIDTQLSSAERAVNNATNHLQRAAQYQEDSSRSKLLFLFILVMFLVVSVTLLVL